MPATPPPEPSPEAAAEAAVAAILAAALPHVPFEGWGETAFRAAVAEAGVAPALARALLPRAGVDLALAFHRRGDRAMAERLARESLEGLRFRDRVAAALRLRLEVVAGEREAVRRAAALFALPHLAPEGARAIWATADAIWTALGDSATGGARVSKRATLAVVWAATLLYWLGDESPGAEATAAFIDRRIADVMRLEEAKGALRRNPLTRPLAAFPDWILSRLPAPARPPPGPPPASGPEAPPGRP